MPNQQQPEQNPQQPQVPEKNRLEMDDEPPPVIEANDANTEGEGDDKPGEGNRAADRNYRRGVKKHIQNKNVEQEAQQAADALDDEGEKKDLEDAEEIGRKGTIH